MSNSHALSSADVSLLKRKETGSAAAPSPGARIDLGPRARFAGTQAAGDPQAEGTEEAEVLLEARAIRKSYRKHGLEIPVLRGVDMQVREGELVSIIGQSGSGKSTLLHLLAMLDSPDTGEIFFEGHRVDKLASKGRDLLRNRYIGIIFQFYHLLPELTMLENVLTPIMIGQGVWKYWSQRRKHIQRAKHLLHMVGLSHRLKHKPRELSGGEMQRAAIARALISQPRLVLADEPTGNLDRKNGMEILEILRTLNAQENLTIVMVTHDNSIAKEAHRTIRLVEGEVERV